MNGVFDDLIPSQDGEAQAQQAGGVFDDLIPQAPQQAAPQQMPTMQQAPAQQRTMLDRVRSFIPNYAGFQNVRHEMSPEAARAQGYGAITGQGRSEEFPELPVSIFVNPQAARTEKGMLNIFKSQFPEDMRDSIKLDFDKFGNPVASIENEIVSRGTGTLAPGKYYFNKPGLSFQDKEMIGPAIQRAALPAAASGIAGPYGAKTAMALTGAAGAASEALGQAEANVMGADEGYSIGDILKAGAFTALGEGAGRGLAKVLDAAISAGHRIMGNQTAKIVDEAGNFTDDFLKATQEKGISIDDFSDMVKAQLKSGASDLTPDQAANKAVFESLGIEPTRPMITREFGDFRTQQQLAGMSETGAPIRQRLSAIDEELFRRTQGISPAGATEDAITAMQQAKMAVTQKKATIDRLVSQQYTKVRNAFGESPLDVKKLAEVVDEAQVDIGVAPAIDGIRKRLIKFGVIDDTGKYLKGINAAQAESLRKEISRKGLAGGETGHWMDEFKSALDDDVLGSLGSDVFGEARGLAARNFREFKDKKIVKELIGDKWDDRSFIDKAIKSKSVTYRDLQELKDTLTTGSKSSVKRGTQAFDDIRGATIKWISEQAQTGRVVGESGQPYFSGANFKKALEQVGDRKLKVLFNKEELDMLNTIKKAGELKAPIPGTVNMSGTSSAWWDMAYRTADKLPFGKYLLGALRSASQGARELGAIKETQQILSPAIKQATERTAIGRAMQPTGAVLGEEYGQ